MKGANRATKRMPRIVPPRSAQRLPSKDTTPATMNSAANTVRVTSKKPPSTMTRMSETPPYTSPPNSTHRTNGLFHHGSVGLAGDSTFPAPEDGGDFGG